MGMRLDPETERRVLELARVGPVTRQTLTEKQFMGAVRGLAKRNGWRWYHTHDSRRSDAGYPDACMVRVGRLIFAELKTEDGKLAAEQANWLEDLRGVGVPVEVYLWRPSDWEMIERVLG